jgi:hypothetical protein
MKEALLIIGLFATSSGLNSNRPHDELFRQLHKLEGMWLMHTRKGTIGEEWTKNDNDHLHSRGFFITGRDTTVTERIALRKQADGIFYISTVENQNNRQPVPFKLTSSDNMKFVFENPDHDFPKRIVYEFVTHDSIHAFIDGGRAASGKRQDFYYKRVR